MKNIYKVHYNGSTYVAQLSTHEGKKGPRGPRKYDEIYENFKLFYGEAKAHHFISTKKILEYIQDRFIESAEDVIDDIPSDVELEELLKKHTAALHRRLERYRKKVFLTDWNFFVTFTYSDIKITEEDFEKKLKESLNNLSSKRGWRYILAREKGSKTDRLHFHGLFFVPEGEMIGQLYDDREYSTKSKRWHFFKNNTYFNLKFGKTEWDEIDVKHNKNVLNYIIKYISKDNGKLIYSKHIPTELELELDVEQDIGVIYKKGSHLFGEVFASAMGVENHDESSIVFEMTINEALEFFSSAVMNEFIYCIPKFVKEAAQAHYREQHKDKFVGPMPA